MSDASAGGVTRPVVARPVVVMGVSGSGKTTVASGVADALGLVFIDADTLHPAANVAKMAAGTPLTDEDRAPWLDAVAARLAEGAVVIACSALKRAYRDRLRKSAPDLALVFLDGTPELLAERMGARDGHYMPSSLLGSQLATLEKPTDDEHALRVDIAGPPDALIDEIVSSLQ